ncbi:MAG: adenylate/guanylate cyclase domain-containing protein [Deltaproteobacteria bacterium]|nr:adenylate/guanylate cyclase domain-containing protein [Deltaproteobacteria bacterium]
MILGYIPMVILITTTAAFGLWSLVRVNRIMAQAVEHDTPLIQGMGDLVDVLLTQELYGRRFLILDSQEMANEFRRRGAEFRRTLQAVRARAPGDDADLEALGRLHGRYEALYAQAFDAARVGSAPSALEESLRRARLDTTDLAQALTAKFHRRRDGRMRLAARTGTTTFRGMLALWGATLLVGVASLTLLTRNITGSIRKLKLASDQVARGRFEKLPVVRAGDELGALSQAFSEMALKVKRLEEASLDANSLTRLPGGVAIENVLRHRLASSTPLAFCIADLDNFKAFNDRYGYALGSEVIKVLAGALRNAVAAHGTKADFLGHVGGDDFVLITSPDRYRSVCEAAIREFDASVPGFYSDEDRARGHIVGLTRQGQEVRFPLVTVSIAVVTNEHYSFGNHIEVAERAAELKEYAKSLPGSVCVADRRRQGDGGGRAEGVPERKSA